LLAAKAAMESLSQSEPEKDEAYKTGITTLWRKRCINNTTKTTRTEIEPTDANNTR